MRKRQKQDILEILQSLYEANREIEAALKNKQPELARNMLCDCQECAIELGNVIDQAEGEGTEAVSYLEKYCEVLFHYHQKLSEMEQLDKKAVEKIKKALDKQIREIENSIRNNIPERQEIVFMPYKASMWDSLESVYLAAKEDPDCDAYCVPIPYFDKNPDGSLGQMHYEIDQYPKNIEVVNRLNYKLEERRPDVIYIHNPYDECNHVTCVHPDYFSSRLKQYTDKLVYIPYFVLQEIEPDDEKSIEQMRHFCFLPGTINADRVIVQSEKMRQIYINEYLKAAKVYGLTGEHLDRAKLEEKFLGLGSPKFDKVVNTRKEDMDVPSEWLKVIEKEDGSWKKIILYNTSINALLKHEEQMLIKMKSVFELFKEHQKEVALLWRPHPLIPSTIQSMRPQLWEKYKEIVEQYKEEGWGIYDDSSDLDRAVVLSDGYYGDESSVARIYKATKKTFIYQDPLYLKQEISNSYKNIPIWPVDFIVKENKIWFVHGKLNCLFNFDCKKNELTILGNIPGEKLIQEGLFCNIKLYKEKLFFVPSYGKEIGVFDIQKEEYKKITLANVENYKNKRLFIEACIYQQYLYCIPYCYENLVKINMDTLYIEYECNQIKDSVRYINDATICGDKMYGVYFRTNEIFRFDIKEKTVVRLKIKDQDCQYSSIVSVGNYLYLYEISKNKIFQYNTLKGAITKEIDIEEGNNHRIKEVGKKSFVLLSPEEGDFTEYDNNANKIFKRNLYKSDKKENKYSPLGHSNLLGVINTGTKENQIVYFDKIKHKFELYDGKKLNSSITIELSDKDYRKMRELFTSERTGWYFENEIYGLNSFFDMENKS